MRIMQTKHQPIHVISACFSKHHKMMPLDNVKQGSHLGSRSRVRETIDVMDLQV